MVWTCILIGFQITCTKSLWGRGRLAASVRNTSQPFCFLITRRSLGLLLIGNKFPPICSTCTSYSPETYCLHQCCLGHTSMSHSPPRLHTMQVPHHQLHCATGFPSTQGCTMPHCPLGWGRKQKLKEGGGAIAMGGGWRVEINGWVETWRSQINSWRLPVGQLWFT